MRRLLAFALHGVKLRIDRTQVSLNLFGMTDPIAEFNETLPEAEVDGAEREARNGLRLMSCLGLSKISAGLTDPKLVLSWLVLALGGPVWIVAALAPLREAGTLLPQKMVARWIRGLTYRKRAWVIGAIAQAGAAFVIAFAALTMTGGAAGLTILLAVGVMAVSSALASVSFREVLDKTIPGTRASVVTGIAGSAGALLLMIFAVFLILPDWHGVGVLAFVAVLAGLLWLAAGALFRGMKEPPSILTQEQEADHTPVQHNTHIGRFALVRGLLAALSLAPPYVVLVVGVSGGIHMLGGLVFAAAAAALVSPYVWGRVQGRPAYLGLAISAFVGAVALAVAAMAGWSGWGSAIGISLIFFVLMLAEQGVHRGWIGHLADVTPKGAGASYAAQANTTVGGVAVILGVVGGVMLFVGPSAALAVFALISLVAGVLALRLKPVVPG